MRIMLVLSRKMNEEIVIGNNVTIKIVGIFGNKVRLGIAAPESGGSPSIRTQPPPPWKRFSISPR
jgi:hypothetical protein